MCRALRWRRIVRRKQQDTDHYDKPGQISNVIRCARSRGPAGHAGMEVSMPIVVGIEMSPEITLNAADLAQGAGLEMLHNDPSIPPAALARVRQALQVTMYYKV